MTGDIVERNQASKNLLIKNGKEPNLLIHTVVNSLTYIETCT